MRIIDTIPHRSINIRIFQMNEKYIVNFEASPMEQVFKFSAEEVKSIEGLKRIINEEFVETVRLRFNEMYLQFKATLDN